MPADTPPPKFLEMTIGELNWRLRSPVPERLAECLARPDSALAQSDRLIKNSKVVTLARIQTRSGQRFILRRINYGKLRHRMRDWFRSSRARRSFQSAFLLEGAGVPTARAFAVSEKRRLGIPIAAYLVTEEIPGSLNLAQYLATGHVSGRAIESVAKLIAELHRAGYSHRDLKLGNILLDQTLDAFLIDLDGLRYMGAVTLERAARDLARLWQGAARYQIPSKGPLKFMACYCRNRGLQAGLRQLAQRINTIARRVGFQPASEGGILPPGHFDETCALGRMTAGQDARLTGRLEAYPTELDNWIRLPGSGVAIVRKDWQETFARAGMIAVDHFLTVAGDALSKPGLGKRYRARLELQGAGECRRAYLKRYSGESFSTRWKRTIEHGKSEPPAAREARVATRLASQGIDVPLPLAVGWDFGRAGRQRSFIVSAEVQGQSAENWVRLLASSRSPDAFQQKKRVACEIALLARRFHETGWCHRDFYLCHIFVHLEREQVHLSLIDLQRVFRPRWRKWRWRIKDLAQLNYSAEQQGISRTLRLRFAKIYFDTERLDPVHRRRIRQIIRKSRWISRHDRGRSTRK